MLKSESSTVKFVEVLDEGFASLLKSEKQGGPLQVEIGCNVYIYVGKLVGVSDDCVMLEDAAIVYETGELRAGSYKDAQRFYSDPKTPRYIMKALIENFGVSTKKY